VISLRDLLARTVFCLNSFRFYTINSNLILIIIIRQNLKISKIDQTDKLDIIITNYMLMMLFEFLDHVN
jgi:hypothetical protein